MNWSWTHPVNLRVARLLPSDYCLCLCYLCYCGRRLRISAKAIPFPSAYMVAGASGGEHTTTIVLSPFGEAGWPASFDFVMSIRIRLWDRAQARSWKETSIRYGQDFGFSFFGQLLEKTGNMR
jgi:hypothetical protein